MFGSELGLGGKFLEMVEQRLGYWPTTLFLYLIVIAVSTYLLKFLYFEALKPLWAFVTSVPPKDIDWPPFIVALLTITILVLVLHSLIRLLAIRRAKLEILNVLNQAETLASETGAILARYDELQKQYGQNHEEYERRRNEIEQEWNRTMVEDEKRREEIEHEWNRKVAEYERRQTEMEEEWNQKMAAAQSQYRRDTDVIDRQLNSKLQELEQLRKEIDDKLPSKDQLEDLKSKLPPESEWKEAVELLRKVEAEIAQTKVQIEKDN